MVHNTTVFNLAKFAALHQMIVLKISEIPRICQ